MRKRGGSRNYDAVNDAVIAIVAAIGSIRKIADDRSALHQGSRLIFCEVLV